MASSHRIENLSIRLSCYVRCARLIRIHHLVQCTITCERLMCTSSPSILCFESWNSRHSSLALYLVRPYSFRHLLRILPSNDCLINNTNNREANTLRQREISSYLWARECRRSSRTTLDAVKEFMHRRRIGRRPNGSVYDKFKFNLFLITQFK